MESHFANDLGLDSFDHVDVIMAMEDEFGTILFTSKCLCNLLLFCAAPRSY